MATVKSTKSAVNKKSENYFELKKYLRLKRQIDDLEEELKELSKTVFADPENLPDLVTVDGIDYGKMSRNPTIPVTFQMITKSGLDIDILKTMATYSMTMVEKAFGSSGKNKVLSTDEYKDELKFKKPTTYYRRK